MDQLELAERRLGNNPIVGPLQFYPAIEPYRICEKFINSAV